MRNLFSFWMGEKIKEFSILASWVRMGHKYGVDTLLEGSLRQLETIFAADFSAWEAIQDESTPLSKISMRPQDAIEAVNLFRLVGRKHMLLTAFYLCCRLATKELLQGHSRADGTPEKLEVEDLQRCLDARVYRQVRCPRRRPFLLGGGARERSLLSVVPPDLLFDRRAARHCVRISPYPRS